MDGEWKYSTTVADALVVVLVLLLRTRLLLFQYLNLRAAKTTERATLTTLVDVAN
jgi:hypothetical protein